MNRTFPVLLDYQERKMLVELGCPQAVPWSVVAPFQERAQLNHDQTLERLAERGGLGVSELLSLLCDQRLDFNRTERASLPRLLELLDSAEAGET